MKQIIVTVLLITFVANIRANAQQIIRLYEGKAPGSESWTQKESEFTHPMIDGLLVRNIVDPTLTVFRPENPNGTAIIVCPGGGFHWLSYQSEGTEVAKWLSERGVTAFVLKYRLVNTGPTLDDFEKAFQNLMGTISAAHKTSAQSSDTAPAFSEEMYKVMNLSIEDGIQAMKYVREHASDYSIDPNRVGMIGFSAGSGVELEVVMKGDPSSMPNFTGHIYGGDTRGQEIPENAPPLFILSAADDNIAASNPDLFKKWREAGKSAELHIYSTGGHAFGMKEQGLPVDSWIDRFGDWLQVQGFIPQASSTD